MNDSYWKYIRQGKDANRAKSAARSFDEKLDVLERMRVRSKALKAWKAQTLHAGAVHAGRGSVQAANIQLPVGRVHVTIVGANPVLLVWTDAKAPAGGPRSGRILQGA